MRLAPATVSRRFCDRFDVSGFPGAGAQVADPGRLNTTSFPVVRLGPLYRTGAAAEDAAVIAATFGVSGAALAVINPDLPLPPGPDGRPAAA